MVGDTRQLLQTPPPGKKVMFPPACKTLRPPAGQDSSPPEHSAISPLGSCIGDEIRRTDLSHSALEPRGGV
jgi:hypothetical protein